MPRIELAETPDFYVEKLVSKTPMPFMHLHRTYELFYVIRGGREYFIEDGFFQLSEGDIVIVPRELLHRTDGKDASRYLVYFSKEYMSKFFTEETLGALSLDRPFVFRPDERERDYFAMLLNTLFNEYTRIERTGNAEDDPTLAGYLYQILFIITNRANVYIPEEYSDGRIGKIVKYINENYNRIEDIEEIASRFYLSKYHLCRIFKQNLGVSLVAYLNTIKVRAACEMIKSGKLSLTEISAECGFNSSSYFCKVFRGEKGTSPAEYKKRHTGGEKR